MNACPDATEVDALQELGDEIATLAAHVHAATHRLLGLIADFDRRRGWEVDGHRSCAHWLAFRTGIDLGAAREKVRTARALEQLPLVSDAMSRGELSFAKVRSLTRVANTQSESELLEFAKTTTAAQLERLVRGYRRDSRLDEAERARIRHGSRTLTVFPDDDGMYVVRGRLDAEVGALLMRAIEAASDALYRTETAQEIEPAQRRADAMGLLAERALAAGFGGSARRALDDCECDDDSPDAPLSADGIEIDEDDSSDAPLSADGIEIDHDVASDSVRNDDSVPISGTRAARYQVVLHVEPGTLQWGREPGRSELEDGTRISAETSRRLSCDASVIRVTHGRAGEVLDVGRRTRTIPAALRRALEVRDRGCTFPGCGLRFTDGHHIVHWADGGPTSLANTCLVCRFHHTLLHEGGYRVELQVRGRPTFYNARGLPVPDAPPALRLEDSAPDALVQQNLLRGIDPDFRTCSARYRREEDIPWPVIVRAVDALEASDASVAGPSEATAATPEANPAG